MRQPVLNFFTVELLISLARGSETEREKQLRGSQNMYHSVSERDTEREGETEIDRSGNKETKKEKGR